ncbi:MAG TPA: endonuclease III [Vicinamibacteria bacterium]|nr:endonuclease III [Vicinamibacteria bacterium]
MRPTRSNRERAAKILDVLEQTYPDADTELRHRNAFELVVATILSAQCTDERVNRVTPALFRRYPTPEAMARARPAQLEAMIRPTGFFRTKSRSILGCARALVTEHDGEVPRTMEAMVKLPGVGRKTSSVVLGHAYRLAEGIAVDTHVLRVSNRLGIARGDGPVEVERQLMALIPREQWIRTTDLLIFHGRRICQARRPACGVCPVFSLCRWPYRQAYALGQTPKNKARARAS